MARVCIYRNLSTFNIFTIDKNKVTGGKNGVITGTLKVYFIFHYWDVESIFHLSLLGR